MELVREHKTKHISFSEYSILQGCTHRHKIQYMDKVRTPGGPALYFGSLIHEALEAIVNQKEYTNIQFEKKFKQATIKFANELKYSKNAEFIKIRTSFRESHVKKMLKCGPLLLDILRDFNWQDYNTIGTEIPLYTDLVENKHFKGYIDWVYKKDNIYYIADFKTSEKGWGPYNRKDMLKRTQLLLYKWFFAKTNNIPLEQIKTQFIIIKWTGKTNNIEFFDIPSTNKKVQKVVANLEQIAVMLLRDKRVIMKNRASCRFCPFENTTYCTND